MQDVITPADRPPLSQNGSAQTQSQLVPSALSKLLEGNKPVVVWLIFLGIGGGLLALYYLRIGYLPDMEWNAALVYLFICSVFGGLIGLLLAISLYLPGVIWSDIIVFEPILDNHLSFNAEHDELSGTRSLRKEPCIKGIIRYLGILFFVALLLSHLVLRASKTIKLMDVYWIIAGLLLVGTFFVMRKIFRHLLKPQEKSEGESKTINRQIFRYSFWFTLSVLLNQIAMYVIYRLADRTPNTYDFLILTGLCTTGVWISTHVVATRHRYYPRQALVAALVAAVLLLFMADRFSSLSMKLMSRYGIGEGRKVNLLVNEKAVQLLSSEGVPTCGPQHLCDVEILSKIGDHYFVRVSGKFYLTLPKSEVISVRRLNSP
jgi:hypothetical protein